MALCSVCGKESSHLESIGSVYICKSCFRKADGKTWKRIYERYDEAAKCREKALETVNVLKYPPQVIFEVNKAFLEQMNAMTQCVCCGEVGRHENQVGTVKICDRCFRRINTSEWQEDDYDDNETVEKYRKHVIKIATKNGYPQAVIDGINVHFDQKVHKDLICSIYGEFGQKLKVFERYCTISTPEGVDVEEMYKAYGRALKRSRSRISSFGASAAKALATGILFPGNTLRKAGVRAVKSAAISMAADRVIPEKEMFRIMHGKYKIDYRAYSMVDFAESGDREKDFGFIRFLHRTGKSTDDIVFLFHFGSSSARKAYQAICKGIELENQPQPVIQEATSVQNIQVNPPISVADEIRKFKELLDQGIISQDEFEAQKKKLLE